MGRGHYSGGSTIIRLSEAGTHFATGDIHEKPRRDRMADQGAVDAKAARDRLLSALMDENFRQRGKRVFPKKTPGWLIEEVADAGGPDAWALGQPGHAKAKALGTRESVGRAEIDPAPPQPQYVLIPASALRQPKGRWRKGKPSPSDLHNGRPASKNGKSGKASQRPTSRPLAGLAPDLLAILRRKGWTVSGKWLMPPTTPNRAKSSAPKPPRARKLKPAHDTARSSSCASRPLTKSSVPLADVPPVTDEEWRRSINWSSATDGGFW